MDRSLLLAPRSGLSFPYETLNVHGRPGSQNWSGLDDDDDDDEAPTATRNLSAIA